MRWAPRSSAGDGKPAHTRLPRKLASSGTSDAKMGFLGLITLDIITVYLKARIFDELTDRSFTRLVRLSAYSPTFNLISHV